MRQTMFIALALAAVALAGCSDEPPSGDFASTGAAYGVAGHVHEADFQAFEDPTPQQLQDAGFTCAGDNAPPELTQLDQYRCTDAHTTFNYLFMELAGTGDWQMAFSCNACSNPADTKSALTETSGGWYWNQTIEGEDKSGMFDQVTLYHGDKVIGHSGISSSSNFEIASNLAGISYTASYSGKTLTVTVSGVSEEAPVQISGWLVKVDDLGVKDHAVEVPLSGNGEFEFKAPENINAYQQFHIHLAGTSINLATGTIA